MYFSWTLLFTLLASQTALAATPKKREYLSYDYYVLEHLPSAGASVDDCANALGAEFVGQVGEIQDLWILRTEKQSSSNLSPREVTDKVLDRFENLRTRAASNRDSYFSRRSTETRKARRVVSSVKHLSRQILRKRVKRDGSLLERAPPPIIEGSSKSVALRLGITDPLFGQQWHLVNDEFPQHMMNATPLWDIGITGEGVISALVDDGLDYKSDDLAANFVCPIH